MPMDVVMQIHKVTLLSMKGAINCFAMVKLLIKRYADESFARFAMVASSL